MAVNLQGGSTNPLQGGNSSRIIIGNNSGTGAGTQSATSGGVNINGSSNPGISLNQSTGGNISLGAPGQTMNTAAVTAGPGTGLDTGQAAAAAATAARISSLQADARAKIQQASDLYDSIFGSAQAAAGDQNNTATGNYNTTVGDINTALGQGLDSVAASYSGRGTGDSSYRANDQDVVKGEANTQIGQAGTDLKNTQTQIGQWLAQQGATRDAGKAGLGDVLGQIASTSDEAQLTSFQNAIASRISDLRASAADNTTSGQALSTLNTQTPAATRVAALTTTLTNIIGGTASPEMKKQIGSTFIANSGLSDADKSALIGQLNGAIDSQATQKTVQPTA